MYNFQIETSFVNLNPITRNPVSAPASTIYLILFTWASPYGTHMEPSCTAHMDAHMGPIWVQYRLLAGESEVRPTGVLLKRKVKLPTVIGLYARRLA